MYKCFLFHLLQAKRNVVLACRTVCTSPAFLQHICQLTQLLLRFTVLHTEPDCCLIRDALAFLYIRIYQPSIFTSCKLFQEFAQQ